MSSGNLRECDIVSFVWDPDDHNIDHDTMDFFPATYPVAVAQVPSSYTYHKYCMLPHLDWNWHQRVSEWSSSDRKQLPVDDRLVCEWKKNPWMRHMYAHWAEVQHSTRLSSQVLLCYQKHIESKPTIQKHTFWDSQLSNWPTTATVLDRAGRALLTVCWISARAPPPEAGFPHEPLQNDAD